MREKLTLTMDKLTIDYLKRIGNVSRYLEGLAKEHRSEWQEALHVVSMWELSEVIGSICEALSGHWWTLVGNEDDIIHALESHGVIGHEEELLDNQQLMICIEILAKEYDRGNEELRSIIKEM